MDTLVRDTDVLRTQLLEARIKGRNEGRAERSIEIARMMKAKGMTVQEIAEMTGLSVEEINALR